jgi:hypothetical protein
MNSKKSHEGYLIIDHSASPGLSDETCVSQGLPPGAGKAVFETATFTCSHCEAVVVKHPFRERARGYCRKCDHYICDVCETKRVLSGGECYPYKAMVADMLEAADKTISSSEAFAVPATQVDKQTTLYPDMVQAPVPPMIAERKPAPSETVGTSPLILPP